MNNYTIKCYASEERSDVPGYFQWIVVTNCDDETNGIIYSRGGTLLDQMDLHSRKWYRFREVSNVLANNESDALFIYLRDYEGMIFSNNSGEWKQ